MRNVFRLAVRVLLLGWTLVLAAIAAAAPAEGAAAWQAPLRPVTVTRGFTPPPTPYAAGHRGVDLAGRPGGPVLSAATGVVSFAGELAGRGVVVVVHGALRTTYEPVKALVKRGVQVVAGQRIGTLDPGHLGCPVAACLHWGLLRGTVYLNPMTLLSAPQVRLLPLDGTPPQPVTGPVDRVEPVGQRTALGTFVSPVEQLGPSPATWSLVALAGAGTLVAFRRRR